MRDRNGVDGSDRVDEDGPNRTNGDGSDRADDGSEGEDEGERADVKPSYERGAGSELPPDLV
ncbi:hypothetical protein ACFQE1_21960, partial [Halobium palmae]